MRRTRVLPVSIARAVEAFGAPWDDSEVSTPLGPSAAGSRGALPTLPRGEVVATFESYAEALQAMDKLAQSDDFPVQKAAIVGNDVKSVERVTGRLSWGRAAGAGALSGLWLGLFFGFVMLVFVANTSPGFLFGAVLIGAAFGMLYGLISYGVTRRLRDFSSTMQMVASSYSVLVDPQDVNRARNVLGLGFGRTADVAAVEPTSPQEPPAAV